MKPIKQFLQRWKLMIIAAAIIAIFHYFGGFHEPESILLGISFSLVAILLYELLRFTTFKPYGITIYVNFDTLRNDLGLLKTERLPEIYEPMYDVYEFTSINPQLLAHYKRYTGTSATEFNLTDRYARSYEEYRSVITFGDKIPCTLKPVKFDNPGNNDPHPIFFFRPGQDGYQFGIHVLPEWWSEHSKQLSAHLQSLSVNHDGTIVLAFLPHGYIPNHVRRWHEPVSLFYPFDRRQRQWKTNLAKHSWAIIENTPDDLHHRYLLISHNNI